MLILKALYKLYFVIALTTVLAMTGVLYFKEIQPRLNYLDMLVFKQIKQNNTILIPKIINFGNLTEAKAKLTLANPNETFRIYIESLGGDAAESIEMAKTLKNSKTVSICSVNNYAYSGAAIILMGCDYVDIPDDAYVMFHGPRVVLLGFTFQLLYGQDNATDRYLKGFYGELRKLNVHNILTGPEWAAMIHGKDIYLTGKQIKERINASKTLTQKTIESK